MKRFLFVWSVLNSLIFGFVLGGSACIASGEALGVVLPHSDTAYCTSKIGILWGLVHHL
jgi:hypothetical protein